MTTPRLVWPSPVERHAFDAAGRLVFVVVEEGGPRVRTADLVGLAAPSVTTDLPTDVRRLPFRASHQPYRSPSTKRSLALDGAGLTIRDEGSGTVIRANVPAVCRETYDFYRWIDEDTVAWTEDGLVVIDARTGATDILIRPGEASGVDVDPALRTCAYLAANGLLHWASVVCADAEALLAFWVGTGTERLSPSQFAGALAAGGEPDWEAAQSLALATVQALLAWGERIAPQVLRTSVAADVGFDLRPMGEELFALLEEAHRSEGLDGHAGVVLSSRPYFDVIDAFREASRAAGFDISSRRAEEADIDYRSAVAYDLRVQRGPLQGRRFADLPNPFAPLLACWATRVVVLGVQRAGVELAALPTPEL